MRNSSIALVSVVFMVVGCGADSVPTQITPTLSISSPSDKASVSLPNTSGPKLVPITFETNWNLKTPGECGADSNCGHINVLVDTSTCNDGTKLYNVQAIVSPAQADFGKCLTPTGQHTVTLELHNDADVIVKTPLGNAVTSKVAVVAQ